MVEKGKHQETSCLASIARITKCIVSRVENLVGEEVYIGDKPFQLANPSQTGETPTIEIRRNLNWITIAVLNKNVPGKSCQIFFQFNSYKETGWEFFDFYHPQYQKNPAIVIEELENLNVILQEFSPISNSIIHNPGQANQS